MISKPCSFARDVVLSCEPESMMIFSANGTVCLATPSNTSGHLCPALYVGINKLTLRSLAFILFPDQLKCCKVFQVSADALSQVNFFACMADNSLKRERRSWSLISLTNACSHSCCE